MIRSQSYTPRPKPLNYDSLEIERGCRDIVGTNFGPFPAFGQLCVADHDEDDETPFNISQLIAATKGPSDIQNPTKPYLTDWCFWVADDGCRYVSGTDTVTLPANSTGSTAPFFADVVPVRLAAAFDDDGRVVMAIQKNETQIQVQWFEDADTQDSKTFTGLDPALIYSGAAANHSGGEDVGLYYRRSEYPRRIYLRRQSEGFETEHLVHENLPTRIASIVRVSSSGDTIILYARDVDGNDVTLTGDPQATFLSTEIVNTGIKIQSGTYFDQAEEADAGNDAAVCAIKLQSGTYFQQTVEDTITDNSVLGISILTGSYSS